MDDSLIPFIALAAAFALLVFSLCLFGVRRFNLRRALGTVDASICIAGNSWQMGVCRYQDMELEWFRLMSLSVVPKYRFKRSSLELLGRRKPTEEELVQVQPDVVVVELQYEGKKFLLAMKFEAYAGLSSWLEAGPVIGVGTWR
ncbi:DUF2550 domain-containing protein [Arthrobacter sp. TES]|uniref:DUF2550 domain-containing protein n=1 Tax=Paenarthrobacter ureafaciens TaxID=37931 RepID=A0AAX3EEZ5_PAEUR|nr:MULTISPECIES: DUF2550 domain-containing protein [Paenarthrobacter]AMB40980.1 hypothetical protein AUT26_12760 [Arthrobacter sp. ATCC 21022]ERI39284.1 hypothetical protein M707_03255 [Arthrobacter sp. AK-YN10]NKR13117.1 hypothetical protein [Arthrobacter sp. M5]NKR15033.1 hypothetical protein [Arthrobacter sp. M6]OEH62569.1 hypothetical protein A5N13_02705 [Arthrobacter sp. D4]OEH63140.1 hypothetical protein A5N17_10945 [Arthrobacter sp. D2]QOI62839.1 DUF2550 domain-containing protein [Art